MERKTLLALLALATLLAAGTLHGEWDTLAGDSADYILLAKSLATGQGYRDIWQPSVPPHTIFPLGFPLLLAPIVAFWGEHALIVMRLFIVCWAGLSLLLWQRWVRTQTTPWVAWTSTGLLATTPMWVHSYQRILSEFPYLAFSLLAIIWASRYRKREKATAPEGLVLVMALVSCVLIRPAGVALAIPTLAWLALESRRKFSLVAGRAMLVGVGVAVPLLAWEVRTARLAMEGSFTYLGFLLKTDWTQSDSVWISGSVFLSRIVENARFYLWALGREPTRIFGQTAPWLATAAGVAGAALIWTGWLGRLRRASAAEWYVLCYIALMVSYPNQDPRRLLPILPWLWLYFLEGGGVVHGLLRGTLLRNLARGFLVGVWVLNLAGCLWIVGLNLAGIRLRPAFRGFVAAHQWLKEHTPPEAVVLSWKPAYTYLMSGRRAIPIPASTDPEKFLKLIRDAGVDFVIDDGVFPETERCLRPFIRSHLDLFEAEVISVGRTILLSVRSAHRAAGIGNRVLGTAYL